jgi:hypothetical protein
MARTEAAHRSVRPGACCGRGSDAAWGVTGLMAKSISQGVAQEGQTARALRVTARLGLMGEGNLIPALARRPHIRWLAEEERARWAAAEIRGSSRRRSSGLWRIGPVRRRPSAHRPDDAEPEACGSVTRQTTPSFPPFIGHRGRRDGDARPVLVHPAPLRSGASAFCIQRRFQ